MKIKQFIIFFIFMLCGCFFDETCIEVVSQKWINNNLNKNAFEFNCTSLIYPYGKIDVAIDIKVKDAYQYTLNIKQARNWISSHMTMFVEDKIKSTYTSVESIKDITCKEVYVLQPEIIKNCKIISDNNESDSPTIIDSPPTSSPANF